MDKLHIKNPYTRSNYSQESNPCNLYETGNEKISEYLEKYQDHKVLNVGCGETSLVDDRVVHLDLFKYNNIDVIADATLLPFANDSFNAIFCHEVLEHVKNPFQVVDEFIRVLDKEGYVDIGIPFLFPFHDVPDHYFNVSSSGIRSLFKEFQPIETGVLKGPWYALANIIGNYKKMLKRVYKDPKTRIFEKIRVFCIYRLLSWGMKFNHKKIALTEEEQNILAGRVYFKGKKMKNYKTR